MNTSLAAALLMAIGAAGCQRPARVSQAVVDVPEQVEVASIGDDAHLSSAELLSRLAADGAGWRERYHDQEKLRAYLDDQIRFELLAKEALRRGFDKDPEVVATARKLMVQKLLRQELDEKLEPESLSDQEIAKFYHDNIGDYRQPVRVRVLSLCLPARTDAEAALATAKAQRKVANSFQALIQAKGQPHGDEDRFLTAEELATTFGDGAAEQIFAIKELGSFGPVVPSTLGYCVVKLTGRKNGFERPLEQVSGQVRQRLYRERRAHDFQRFVDKLRQDYPVSVNQVGFNRFAEAVAREPVPAAMAQPASLGTAARTTP